MEGLTDTTVTYSKLPYYLQPYSQNISFTGHGTVPVGYISATAQPVSPTHQLRSADEPHLGITPSPSPDTPSSDHDDDIDRAALFKPVDLGGVTVGMCRSLVPLTPSESSRSGSSRSDRGSSNEDDRSGVSLVVQIPRHCCQATLPPTIEPAEKNCTNGATSSPLAPATPTPAHEITVNVLDEKLWQMFKSVGNEMIVTKQGR